MWLGLAVPAATLAGMTTTLALWQITLIVLAFAYGRASESLEPLWRGLAPALGLSSLIAIGQVLAVPGLPPYYLHPAGLFYSPAVQASMIALVSVALAERRTWFLIPPLLPGLVLAQSRGGWLVLAIGLTARWLHGALAFAVLAAAGIAAAAMMTLSDQLRLATWKLALANLTLFGNGAGTFANLVFYDQNGSLVYPEHVHNDYLELAYEYGVGALIPYAVMIAALCRTRRPGWPVFAGYCALSAFYFPLYCAPLALVGSVVAGHLLAKPAPKR